MAEKVFLKTFEKFKGLDYKTSPLTSTSDEAVAMFNFEFGEGDSVKGTKGRQVIGQPGGFSTIKKYVRTDAATSAPIEELIGINDTCWKLKTGYIKVNGTNLTCSVATDATGTDYRLVINSNGTPLTFSGNPYISLGNPASSTLKTVYDTIATIDAHASLTASGVTDTSGATALKFAKTNAGTVLGNVFTVLAGHTYVVGDIITFWDISTANIQHRIVTAKTATTITFNASATSTVISGQIIGPLSAYSCGIPVVDVIIGDVITGNMYIPFYYWDIILSGELYPNEKNSLNLSYYPQLFNNPTGATLPTAANANNALYIAAQDTTDWSSAAYRINLNPHYRAELITGSLLKYDGNRIYRAGPPTDNMSFYYSYAQDALAGSMTAGVYKYIYTYEFIDAQGNVVESEPYYFTYESPKSYTVTGGNTRVAIGIAHSERSYRWCVPFALATGAAAGNVIPVDDGAGGMPTLRVGDYAIFNGSTVIGTPTRRKITAIDYTGPYSITVDGAAPTVINNDVISGGLVVNVWRTLNGGSGVFYLVGQVPVGSMASGSLFTMYDQSSDATIEQNRQYIPSLSGEERNVPPLCSIVAEHQGVLALAGDKMNPNTVHISDAETLEYYSAATKFINVPATDSSSITAMISDTDDRFAVFKKHSYYEVVGDMTENAVSVRTVRDGDLGIDSPTSLIRSNGVIFGVGQLGVVGFTGGQIKVLDTFSQEILNNPDLDLGLSVGFNDSVNRKASFVIPCTGTTETGYYPKNNDSTNLTLIYNYHYYRDNPIWTDAQIAGKTAPTGGAVVYGDELYSLARTFNQNRNAISSTTPALAVSGLAFKENAINLTQTSDAELYVDAGLATIRNCWTTDWETFREPNLYKIGLRLRLFSFLGEFETGTAFSVVVNIYKDYNDTTIWCTETFTFNGTTEFEKMMKTKPGKWRALRFEFVSNTIKQCPYISGFECVVYADYIKEDLLK